MIDKTKILFFHFDLGVGGAEKVLLNLVNNLPQERYDITLCLLFNSGVRKKDLAPHIRLTYLFDRKPFRGVTKVLQLLSPRQLYRLAVKEKYDVEIAYIEGIPARIVSGSTNPDSKKFTWVHSDSLRSLRSCFRSECEAVHCYSVFDKIAFVSDLARDHFVEHLDWKRPVATIHNVVDTVDIISRASENIPLELSDDAVNLCIVGRLHIHKSHARLINALSRVESRNWHLYVVGDGELRADIERQIAELGLSRNVTLLGFENNPYKYMARMDAIVCSSVLEGFSTVASEAMVLGIPFITTDCAGMSEIIEDGKSGLIVSNDEDGLVDGLARFITDGGLRQRLKAGAVQRGRHFSITEGIAQFEEFVR